MRRHSLFYVAAVIGLGQSAWADSEASNRVHVVAGESGRCYAKSVPEHVYDPNNDRQSGRTDVFVVDETMDRLVRTYDWFAQELFVLCDLATDDAWIVRLGPWQRGHTPRADHLAIAFYHAGAEQRSYSTLDISGDEPSDVGSISDYKNVSASVSHYTVFAGVPKLLAVETLDGAVSRTIWAVSAMTIDGRELAYNAKTGAPMSE